METHVIHDVHASMIIDQKVDIGERVRSGNIHPRLFADDETGRTYYRLKSWPPGNLAADGIAVYVSEDLSEERAIAAEDDHWRRLRLFPA